MSSRNKISTAILLILFLVTAGPLLSHTLYLKDGRVIRGRILAQTAKEIRIDVSGSVLTFQKSDVRQVDFEQEVKPLPVKPADKPTEKPAEASKTPFPLNRWTIAGRSALIPGWGHYAIGDRWKGAGYLTASVLAAGYAYSRRSASLSAHATYQSENGLILVAAQSMGGGQATQLITSMLLNNASYAPYQSAVDSFNNSLRILGLIYGLQVAHAYYSGRAYDMRTQGTAVLPVPDGPRGQGLALVHYWTF